MKAPPSKIRSEVNKDLQLSIERRRSHLSSFRSQSMGSSSGLQKDGLKNKNSSRREINVNVHGLVGLVNEGNTCYLNSCLQCLAHCMPLISVVQDSMEMSSKRRSSMVGRSTMSARDRSSKAEQLASTFRQVMKDLWHNQAFTATSARVFLHCVQSWAPQFMGHSQHDAQEVLRAILDGLHEAFNRVTTPPPYRDLYVEPKPEEELADITWRYHKSCQDSIIQDIFCGQLQSTIECCTCHRKSHCFDPFQDLSLPLPKGERDGGGLRNYHGYRGDGGSSSGAAISQSSRVTIHDCLSAFVAPEQLDGSNKYYCPTCKAPRTSIKKLTLYRLPPVLVLHIKRFYKSERYSYQKDDTPVSYPLQGLDFSNYLSSKARRLSRAGVIYDLYGVCCHMGSLGGGHYIAQCKNCESNGWYCFNDSMVTSLQENAFQSSSAYILFYQQQS